MTNLLKTLFIASLILLMQLVQAQEPLILDPVYISAQENIVQPQYPTPRPVNERCIKVSSYHDIPDRIDLTDPENSFYVVQTGTNLPHWVLWIFVVCGVLIFSLCSLIAFLLGKRVGERKLT